MSVSSLGSRNYTELADIANPITPPRGEGKGSGAYDVNILNVLGRQQKASRNKLYQSAIKNPEGYLHYKSLAEQKIVDKMVCKLHEDFKTILLVGKQGNTQVLLDGDGEDYQPRLPEATISKYAVRACETIEKVLEEMIEECYPKSYEGLSKKKMGEYSDATQE